MLLANKHYTMVMGMDIHMVTIPPGVPSPIPHPFIGFVMDPMDYVPFIGSTVFINGVPRGTSDTNGMLGIAKHIPMGGPFTMMPMIGHESVNFFGSLTVKAQGMSLSPAGYMVMSCNDIGMPLTATPGKKMKPRPSLFLPSSQTVPLPGGKPVMVGGPYAPDLAGAAKRLAMSYGFGGLLKVGGKAGKAGLSACKKKTKAAGKHTKGQKDSLTKCIGDPVDMVTGRVIYGGTDFELPGPLPVTWERNWYSDSSYEGPLGHGMHHCYDLSLHFFKEEEAIMLVLPDGRTASFPFLVAEGESFYNRMEKLTLTCVNFREYRLKDHEKNLTYTFRKEGREFFSPVKLENTAGQALYFTYNQRSCLTWITDTAGREIRLHLDHEDRIKKITARHKKKEKTLVEYRYNEAGDMEVVADALGQETRMQYRNHLMVAKTDRNGQTFYWEYDGHSTGARCIHTWGDGGLLEVRLDYGQGKNVMTDSLGRKTVCYYNADNLCTQITDPEGNHIFHEYTDYFEPYRDIDEEGNLTGYTYDDRGNLKSVVYPDMTSSVFVYDDQDRQILSVSPEGRSTVKVYNEQGLLWSVEDPDGSVSSFQYNGQGLVESIRDNKGRHTTFKYDGDHNLAQVTFPDGAEQEWCYDAFGRCFYSKDPEKREQNFYYDDLGRPVRVCLADGNIIKLSYNAYDEVVRAEDMQHKVRFEYTPLGSIKLREEDGAKVHFRYDTEEQLKAIINEHGEVYRFKRNGRGDIVEEAGFDGLTRKYVRDKAGKVIKVERPGGRHTTYEYNRKGQIWRAEHSDGTWETYAYDKDGQLIEAVNQHSKVILTRDKNGRVIKEDQDGYTVESSYDKLGLRQHIGSSLGADIQLGRNESGFVTSMQASQQGMKLPWQAEITYNSLGQELDRVLGIGNVKNQFAYDLSGRPREQKTWNGTGARRLHRHKQYYWHPNDRLQRIHDVLTDTATRFRHDSFGNLIESLTVQEYRIQGKENYFRDEVGNIFREEEKKDRKYGAGGKLLENKGDKYSYDEEGNLIQKTTKEGNWIYEWNGNGSLKQVTRPDNKTVSFEYDALGRRTAKLFDGKITRWVWDGNTPIHEWHYKTEDRPIDVVDEFGFISKDREEPVENLITWVFDDGSFKPAAKIVDGEYYSIINDYLGTPKEAYDKYSDCVWKCEHEAYGKVRSCEGEVGFIPFRFQGQYHDVETGLYYNRFRYYAPDEAMYVSQDPIGLEGGDRFYGYVGDALAGVDRLGLNPIVVIGEGQKAVNEAAKLLKAAGYNAESMMYPKVQWKGGVLYDGMPKADFDKAVQWNKEWLMDKIKNGYTVVDIGSDGRSKPSKFYKAELEAVKEVRGKRIKVKIFPNGETVEQLRSRLKCK
ncbi:DUF6531 domain-containing protein [Cytophagaceae bacterium ABcell3]|nr:DUF6531 domain-containing protein [Cytophagaceae bacterium ABcell3]